MDFPPMHYDFRIILLSRIGRKKPLNLIAFPYF